MKLGLSEWKREIFVCSTILIFISSSDIVISCCYYVCVLGPVYNTKLETTYGRYSLPMEYYLTIDFSSNSRIFIITQQCLINEILEREIQKHSQHYAGDTGRWNTSTLDSNIMKTGYQLYIHEDISFLAGKLVFWYYLHHSWWKRHHIR